MLNQVSEQQRAGRTQRQLIRLLLPVVVEKKLAIDSGDFVIAGERFFLQRERGRAAIPNLLAYPAQVFIGAVKMYKREIAADIPGALIAFWHQAETVRPAAVFPAVGRFLVTFVAIGNIQAQGMVVALYRNSIKIVIPCRQLNTGVELHRLAQHGIFLTQCFESPVSHSPSHF